VATRRRHPRAHADQFHENHPPTAGDRSSTDPNELRSVKWQKTLEIQSFLAGWLAACVERKRKEIDPRSANDQGSPGQLLCRGVAERQRNDGFEPL